MIFKKEENNKIDLKAALEDKANGTEKKKSKPILKAMIFIAIFIFVCFAVFSNQVSMSDPEQEASSWIFRIPIIGQIKRLVESADKELKGESSDRINILLLGMGGKNHDGGLLTDTIMLCSLKPSENKASFLSIPRDLSVPLEGRGWRKINNINAYAETQTPDSGGLAASQAISDILNIPIDYYVRLDFSGFVNVIDELGGIEIYLDNALDDKFYPIMGKEADPTYEERYENFFLEKGWHKMDGETALKFVRSRHSAGVEGSDFARSRRQQKVLNAVKEKVVSKFIIFKPKMISDIISELNEHVSTNLKIWEIVKLWDMSRDIKDENIINKSLDNSPNGLLVDMVTEDGAYILTPRNGDFSEIQYLVNNMFSEAPISTKTRVVTEKTSVEVLNGTWVNGLASRVALDLEKYGFNITRINNFDKQKFDKSIIYDLTYGKKINSLTVLKEKTNAEINFGIPEWLIQDLASQIEEKGEVEQPDFILILGQNADTTGSGTENIDK